MPNQRVLRPGSRRSRGRQNRQKGKEKSSYVEDAWSLAKRTAAGLNEIRKFINVEVKNFDQLNFFAALNYTGVVVPLSQMAQGTDEGQRVGDSIRMMKLYFAFTCENTGGAVTSQVRLIIFKDMEQQGVLPPAATVDDQAASTYAVLAPITYVQSDRFVVLYDKRFSMSLTGEQRRIDGAIIEREGHIRYTAAAAAAASNHTGSLYAYVVSDIPPPGGATQPTAQLFTRLLFTDD